MTERRNLQFVLDAAQSGACVISPNTRAARNLKRTFADRQRANNHAAWRSPEVLPWSAWLKRLWQEQLLHSSGHFSALLDERQERYLWERIIAADQPNLDPGSLALECSRAWRTVHAYRIPREKGAFRRKPDTAAFFRWSSSYASVCERNGWLDEARLPDQLHAMAVTAIEGREIIFWGFDFFTPQQQALVSVLEAACVVRTIGEPDSESAAASRIASEDSHAELRAAALWAREILEEEPKATVGVVVHNLDDLRGAAERIFLEVLHPGALTVSGTAAPRAFEISLGVPISKAPIIATALAVLELASRSQSSEFVGRLLRSPFLGDPDEMSARAVLDTEIRSRGLSELSLDSLRDAADRRTACRGFAIDLRNFQTAVARLAGPRSPSAWSREILPLLSKAGWPGSRGVNSREYQAQRAFVQLLSEFARLDLVAEPMEFAAMVRRLVRAAEEKIFQPENLGAPVQLVGLLEASGSRFDYLWVMGLHAAAWPPEAHPSPFIPIDLQRLHNVKGAFPAERLDYARETMKRLLHSAGNVIVSWPMREQDVELTMSPLIAEFPEIARAATPVTLLSFGHKLFASAAGDNSLDDRGPIVTEPISSGGTKAFKLQAACPFRAFAELRLDASELTVPEPGVDRKLRGHLLHKSLEIIWSELQSQAELQVQNKVKLEELVTNSIERAVKQSDHAMPAQWEQQVVAIERDRLKNLILRLLELESGRPTPFRVIELEKKREVTHGGITVDVKVDRIDELEGGGLVLLDYKSGKPTLSQWDGDRPEDPQVPVYATELGSRLAAAGFVQINSEEITFKGYAKHSGVLPGSVENFESMSGKKRPAPSFEEMLQNWRDTLDKLGSQFRAGHAAVDPKNRKKTCNECHLGMLCRVNEVRPGQEEDEYAG
ncbi:MAG: PD-(D/E)XK nuclease family protein [Terriglobia bacterium]|nr:PD-(D/E)XK nuclease family protein [Terriglobia bacterium]